MVDNSLSEKTFISKAPVQKWNPNNVTPKVWLQLCTRKNGLKNGYMVTHTPSQHSGPIILQWKAQLQPHITQVSEAKPRKGKSLQFFRSTRHPVPLGNLSSPQKEIRCSAGTPSILQRHPEKQNEKIGFLSKKFANYHRNGKNASKLRKEPHNCLFHTRWFH